MRFICSGPASLLLALCVGACHGNTPSEGCSIEGPQQRLPEKVKRVRLGMTMSELEAVLGPAAYSPIEGQYYFSTGGDCPLQDSDRVASCGVVAEFRDYSNSSDGTLTESLQSCWWGGIGE
jgi:hypothetical protein